MYIRFININEGNFSRARSSICDFYITFRHNDHYVYLAESWNYCQRNNVGQSFCMRERNIDRWAHNVLISYRYSPVAYLFARPYIQRTPANPLQCPRVNISLKDQPTSVTMTTRQRTRPIDYNREDRNCSRTTFPSKLFVPLSAETRLINRTSALASSVPKQSSEPIAATCGAPLGFVQRERKKERGRTSGKNSSSAPTLLFPFLGCSCVTFVQRYIRSRRRDCDDRLARPLVVCIFCVLNKRLICIHLSRIRGRKINHCYLLWAATRRGYRAAHDRKHANLAGTRMMNPRASSRIRTHDFLLFSFSINALLPEFHHCRRRTRASWPDNSGFDLRAAVTFTAKWTGALRNSIWFIRYGSTKVHLTVTPWAANE